MTLLWLWAFSLKTPITVICAVAIIACFLSWLSAKSQRGEPNLTTLHIGIVIAIVWSFIYAIPSPNYNVKTVIKEVPKPYPVVRTIKYVAQKQTLTRTITLKATEDTKFDQCMEYYAHHTSPSEGDLEYCRRWSRQYMQARFMIQQVKVPVPSGVQIKIEHDPFAKLFDQCNDGHTITGPELQAAQIRNERIKECTDYALKGSHDH